MTQYRLYLCDRVRIIGRQDFAARSDAEAVAVAAAIFEACSDMCESFEVWRGDHFLDCRFAVAERRLTRERQERCIAQEELLLQSRCAVAKSRTLLTRLADLRAQGAVPPFSPRPTAAFLTPCRAGRPCDRRA